MTRDLTTLAGVKIEFNSEVVSVDAEAGTVQLANGRTYSADLIVGADGPNSVAREAIVGEKEEPEIGPYCTYSSVSLVPTAVSCEFLIAITRFVVSMSEMMKDQGLASLCDDAQVCRLQFELQTSLYSI